jgi:2-iminobutanoate/2-iminopropanoate deaminase
MNGKKVVNLPGSVPIAPYSPAVEANGFVYVAGQVGFDPVKKRYYGDDIAAQTRGALQNLKTVLECAGSALEKVVKTTIFLTDVEDFDAVNAIYAEYFEKDPPARSCVQVAALPKGALMEIEAVALR